MKIFKQLSGLFQGTKRDADMAEEMRLHLEQRTRDHIAAGLSPDEARYAARRKFGGVEQAKELARDQCGWVWFEQLRQDVRHGLRSLLKTPGFTGIAIPSKQLKPSVTMHAITPGFRFKRFVFPPVTALCVALAISAAAIAAAPARPKILIDLGHGQAGFVDPAGKESPRLLGYRAIAGQHGVDLATTSEPLTAATLKGVRVLALMLPQTPFDDAAIAAVTAFVRSGGALLVITDEEARAKVKMAEMRLNEIIGPFGLKFTGDTPDPHNCGALAAIGPVNPIAREIPFSGGRAVEGGTGFSFTLDAAGKPTTRAQAAFATAPAGGKVIAMGDGMPMLFLGRPDGVRLQGKTREDTLYWGRDAREFMTDVLGWLAKK